MIRVERIFVWLGGAMFIASLGVCLYYYVVVWNVAPAANGHVELRDGVAAGRSSVAHIAAIAADTVLFGLFAAHHSLLARASAKALLTRVIPERLLRSVYVWTASLLFVGVMVAWQRVAGDIYRATGWRAAMLTMVQLAGVWLIVQSARAIDALELAGIRHPTSPERLQVAGPYRWIRHPLYLGWMLWVFAPPHLTGDRLTFAVVSSLYIAIAIPWEERALTSTYAEDYLRYKRAVRWRLLPFVY